jgi:hypothetical protein
MGQISKSVPVTDTSLLRYPPFVVVRAELVDEEDGDRIGGGESISLPPLLDRMDSIHRSRPLE